MNAETLSVLYLLALIRACSQELRHLQDALDQHNAWLERFARGPR